MDPTAIITIKSLVVDRSSFFVELQPHIFSSGYWVIRHQMLDGGNSILNTQYYKINILQKEKDKLALVTESYG